MNPKTHKSPVLCIVALLAILALTSLACSFSAFGVRPYSPDVDVDLSEIDIPEINVTIREAQFNHLSPHADIHIGSYCDPLDEVNRIELHDGFIRFVGTRHQWGAADVDGSLDLSLSSENNMLKAKLIAVECSSWQHALVMSRAGSPHSTASVPSLTVSPIRPTGGEVPVHAPPTSVATRQRVAVPA